VDPMGKYPIWATLLYPFRESQQKTLALVIAAIVEVAQARSVVIASCIAQWVPKKLPGAINRFYRLLRNPRIDDWLLTRQLLSVLQGVGSRLVIAIDWTEWHEPLRMLLASVVVGTRAIPVAAATFDKHQIPRSQNSRENAFLTLLADQLERLFSCVTVAFVAPAGLVISWRNPSTLLFVSWPTSQWAFIPSHLASLATQTRPMARPRSSRVDPA